MIAAGRGFVKKIRMGRGASAPAGTGAKISRKETERFIEEQENRIDKLEFNYLSILAVH